MIRDPKKIRNVAIIAHIDHGKTTLLDALLRQAETFRAGADVPERVMDSYDQERERGITIFSKHTSLKFEDYQINVVDTPGHADFSGEVERVLDMVNCVLLLVDAQEGPMPQTRFVLSQALKRGHKPLVVVNKIDRPNADPDRVLNETFDLFVELGASDSQLDFPVVYASGLAGFACLDPEGAQEDMRPLLQKIVDVVEAPPGDLKESFVVHVASLIYDEYLGRGACGRILQGIVRKGDRLVHCKEGVEASASVTRVQGFSGLQKIEMDGAGAGDIAVIYGFPDVLIGDTLSVDGTRLPSLKIIEPTLSIQMMVNSGPLAGREGRHVTMNKIRDRLMQEKKANITYRIEEEQDRIQVAGRGELHLAVLLEAMRREGFEFCISKPKVLMQDGLEPVERVYVEVPDIYSGAVIEALSKRRAEMQAMETNEHGICRLEFLAPTRGLMGFRHAFLTMTRGNGVMSCLFDSFKPHFGPIPHRKAGVLVSMSTGKATGYACFNLQGRGKLFVKPSDDIYEGMIVGEHSRDNDLPVNITKEKQLTNVRSSGTDENVILTPPVQMNLEQAIDYIEDDELLEVTPLGFRLRKILLKEHERKRNRSV